MDLKSLLKRKKNTKFYFFSGKGGVGKTSTAAATAFWFAKKGEKVLVISTDPAHSLSDSFEIQIGGQVKELQKNLSAVEIDPKLAMSEYKAMLKPQIEKMEYLKGLGLDGMFDIAESTPGIDEIAAFDKFLRYMNSKDYDVIIFDTAPTGHALRFLSLPDVLDSWVGKIIKIRMKFSGMIDMFKKLLPFGQSDDQPKLGTEQLEEMKNRIKQAREILSDNTRTNFNLVLIPEQMAILETKRAIKALANYQISAKTIIVNQLIPKNPSCNFCSTKRKTQQTRLIDIKKSFKSMKILSVPMFKQEVYGFKMLEKIGKILYSQKK